EADSERLDRLTGRLLELARADSTVPGEDEGSDPVAVLGKVKEIYRDKDGHLEFAWRGHARVTMRAPDLETVIVNLIENAKQHGGDGVAISVAGEVMGREYQIRVKDNGTGISPANQQQIFK